MKIPTTHYSYWTSLSEDIEDIRIEPRGSATYESWIGGKSLAGNSLNLSFSGVNDKGHNIGVYVTSILSR